MVILQMGGISPYENADEFGRFSRFIQHASTPTLITHGDKDYRVPVEQGIVTTRLTTPWNPSEP